MYKYEVILYWSNVDGAFVAEVPELPEDTSDKFIHSLQKRLRGDNFYSFLVVSVRTGIDENQFRFGVVFFELSQTFEVFTPCAC